MTDYMNAVGAKFDTIRVRVITRHHEIEGDLHCPRTGKQNRNFSQFLNAGNKVFLALTNAHVMNGQSGGIVSSQKLVQVNVTAIEFLFPVHGEQDAVEIDSDLWA